MLRLAEYYSRRGPKSRIQGCAQGNAKVNVLHFCQCSFDYYIKKAQMLIFLSILGPAPACTSITRVKLRLTLSDWIVAVRKLNVLSLERNVFSINNAEVSLMKEVF
jgi:hypothetical protein